MQPGVPRYPAVKWTDPSQVQLIALSMNDRVELVILSLTIPIDGMAASIPLVQTDATLEGFFYLDATVRGSLYQLLYFAADNSYYIVDADCRKL